MEFLPDPSLYSRSEACLIFLRSLPEGPGGPLGTASERTPVHFVWRGPFGAKPALCLKSFFATQSRVHFECWLWLENYEDYVAAAANPHLGPFLALLRLQHFDAARMAEGTSFSGQTWIKGKNTAAQASDIARLLILYRHGGIYSDLDALFLRDLRPLLRLAGGAEFGFQWSSLRRGTNAFCFHHRASPVLEKLMASANRFQSAHASALFDFDGDTLDFLVLPSTFFSPLWLLNDRKETAPTAPFARFEDFFRHFRWWFRGRHIVKSHRDFFPGAFTYHWHGRWRSPEAHDSFAGIVARSLEADLANSFPELATLPAYGGSR